MANAVFLSDSAVTDTLVKNTEPTWLSFAQKPLMGSELLLRLKIFSEWT